MLKDIIKQQNKIASDWLVYYRERKREHEERRQELYSKREKAAGLSTHLSKPTETLAVNLADHDNSNEAKWLRAVEATYSILSPRKRMLLEFRQECKSYTMFERGRPGWIVPVQTGFAKKGLIYADITLKAMWYDIINLTVRISTLQGCKFLLKDISQNKENIC